jgi:hypothetical protein
MHCSPRRSNADGLQAAYILPGPGSIAGTGGPVIHSAGSSSSSSSSSGSSSRGSKSRDRGGGHSGGGDGLIDEIQLLLLDERWFRESLPCSARENWCALCYMTRHWLLLWPPSGCPHCTGHCPVPPPQSIPYTPPCTHTRHPCRMPYALHHPLHVVCAGVAPSWPPLTLQQQQQQPLDSTPCAPQTRVMWRGAETF